jgi:hypothetical protein
MSFGRAALVLLSLALVTTAARTARADDDCPLGSSEKKESGFTWCEPSVCDADNQCPTGSVCRPVPLCVEIGAVDGGGAAAGARLLVRQRCGVGKACPQNTTCSEKSRCITLAQADKAGLTSVTPGSSASATPASSEPPKKACGCDVPGGRTGGGGAALLLVAGATVIAARRRARLAR